MKHSNELNPEGTTNHYITIIATVLDKDWCAMVREIKAETGIRQTTVHCILTEYLLKENVAHENE